MDTSRKTYNNTVEYLKSLQGPRDKWNLIANKIIGELPDWAKKVPYQIKKIAVKDACRAFTQGKIKAKKTKEPFELKFRSRRNPVQSCFIPKSAIKPKGIYPRVSGIDVSYAEPIPTKPRDSRLVCRKGYWYLCIPQNATRKDAENQGRVVALDPGIRTFQTFFSPEQAGFLGKNDFGRIVRLCYYLDNLISRASKEKSKKKHRMLRSASRMRQKIRNLVDELHWKTIRYLIDNFDIAFLPTFETQDMVRKATRKINSKSARNMMNWAHYRFKQRFKHKAFEENKIVIDSNEAWTSKTASWSGVIKQNLGSTKAFKGADGIKMDRDMNGARGIFLRALKDTSIVLQ